MRGTIRGEGPNTTYFLDGEEVTEEKFREAFPPQPVGGGSLIGFKPVHSEALAVHPNQVAEAKALAKQRGIPIEFDKHSRPIFTSSRHFREYAKRHGFRHKGY